jgi:hypothetical protein
MPEVRQERVNTGRDPRNWGLKSGRLLHQMADGCWVKGADLRVIGVVASAASSLVIVNY